MPREAWKADELWFARWTDGQRYPSQGKEHADVLSPGLSIEHKRRAIHITGEWFKTASRQKDTNSREHPDRFPLVGLTVHGGKGQKKRRYIVIEIEDRWLNINDMIAELAEKRGLKIERADESGKNSDSSRVSKEAA